ncbi:hypothetical protein [Flavobacterium sp.]|uniref:hypothetical protein n=1 Tax=Flavobacterium sp. TaxID=239 RepID=UPI0031D44AAD
MINKKFKLFSNCFAVKGINRGIIIDFQRKNYYTVPNQIVDLLDEYSGKEIYSLFSDFNNDKPILKKYIRFFLSNELIIVNNDISQYPAISTNFERPYSIDTLTLDSNLDKSILKNFLEMKIDGLGVSNLRMINEVFNLQEIIETLKFIDKSRIKSVVLYLKYAVGLETELIKLQNKFPRIVEVVFYDAKEIPNNSKFIYEQKSLEEVLAMKIRNHDDFTMELSNFNESLKYNFAYNRTLFIDSFGNIKRYITDESIFGNLNTHDLNKIVQNNEIIDFWEISRDKINVCKDCEFRYICPDGSVPLKTTQDKYYTSSQNCSYSPYSNKWS